MVRPPAVAPIVGIALLLVLGVAPSMAVRAHVGPPPVPRSNAPAWASVSPARGALAPTFGALGGRFADRASTPRPSVGSALTIIYPNGTISNASAPIIAVGSGYSITASFTGGLAVERSHTFVRGNGFRITTDVSLTTGVSVVNASGVNIHGLSVAGGQDGFLVTNSSFVMLVGDHANNSVDYGIQIQTSVNVTVSGSTDLGSDGIGAFYDDGVNLSLDHVQSSAYFAFDIEDSFHVQAIGDTVNNSFGDFLLEYDGGSNVSHDTAPNGYYGLYAYAVDPLTIWEDSFNGSEYAYLVNGCTNASVTDDRATNATNVALVLSSFDVVVADDAFGGSPGDGLSVQSSTEVTVRSTNLSDSAYNGVLLDHATNVTLTNVTVAGFQGWGITVNNSNDVNLTDVNASYGASSGSYGYYASTDLGLVLDDSASNFTAYGFYGQQVIGLLVLGSWFDNATYGAESGQVENSQYVAFENVQFDNDSGQGLGLFYTTWANVTDSDFSGDSITGLSVESGSSDIVQHDRAVNDGEIGIGVWSTLASEVLDDYAGNVSTPYGTGIVANSDTDLVVEGNLVVGANESYDLEVDTGVYFVDNNGSTSYFGLYLFEDQGCQFLGNTLYGDQFAFLIAYQVGVAIYHNNFDDDSGWEIVSSPESIEWDDGYPGGGNHWSNWTGPDLDSGPGQNLSGSDGIVDRPMVINATNVDRYPLVRPWTAATLTFTETGLAPGTVWSVRVGTSVLNGSTTSLVYSVPTAANQSLGYQVVSVAGYGTPSPPSGAVEYNGTDAVVPIAFAPFTYTLTFQETGLASGTAWSVSVGAQNLLGSGPSLSVPVANGTYAYRVGNVTSYALTTPSGSAVIMGHDATVTVSYELLVHPVVYDNTTTVVNHTVYDNGTNSTGGSGGPHGGSTSGTGSGATSSGYAPMVVYALVGVVAALAVLAALGFAMWGRARRGTPPPGAQPWTPPAAGVAPVVATAPTPAATTLPVVAGAPDWKEDP